MKKETKHLLPADKLSLLHDAYLTYPTMSCQVYLIVILLLGEFRYFLFVFACKSTERVMMSDGEDDSKHSVFNICFLHVWLGYIIVKLASYLFFVNYNKLLTSRTQIEIIEISLITITNQYIL